MHCLMVQMLLKITNHGFASRTSSFDEAHLKLQNENFLVVYVDCLIILPIFA